MWGKLTLKKNINLCRSTEATKGHMKLMSLMLKVHSLCAPKIYLVNNRGKLQKYSAKGTTTKCKFCGQEHVFKKFEYPAWGATYKKLYHRNHFAIV